MKILLLILAAVLGTFTVHSQQWMSSEGRDFWLAFPPTEHTSRSGRLSIFLSSENTTNVTIAARSRRGVVTTTRRTVNAGEVVEEVFDRSEYELASADFPVGSPGDCEIAVPTSIHITSEADISVYGSVRDNLTSDAWLALPTHVLGLEYRVMSYPSDYVSGFMGMAAYYPSQFVIIATEDSTIVDLTLSLSRTRIGLWKNRTIKLNRGESYLVQASVSSSSRHEDLTGTVIRSNKPIGVLGSHLRAQVPLLSSEASRDILIEQLPSVDTWGKRFVVPPLHLPADARQAEKNDVSVIRVLAHYDSTDVSVDGGGYFPLVRAGNIWEMPLQNGRTIVATKPVLVAIVDRSTKRDGNVTFSGDPSLIIIPPIEQYLSKYRTISIEPRPNNQPIYNEHWITVFAPLTTTGIRVDGNAVPALTPFSDSTFGYAHIKVNGGSHFSESPLPATTDSVSGFGILVYGYGPAESYGYTGGMAFSKLYQPTIWLRVADANAEPGDSVHIAVVVDSVTEQASLDAMQIRQLNGRATFNSTILVPAGLHFPSWSVQDATHGMVDAGSSFTALNIGDTVAMVHGVVVLGTMVADTVRYDVGHWLNQNQQAVPVTTHVLNGLLTVNGICRENGERLFDPTAPLQHVRTFDVLGREVPKGTHGLLFEINAGTVRPVFR